MREYIGAFFVGIGSLIASVVLPIVFPNMPHSIAIVWLVIGILFIVGGFTAPFVFPRTKKLKKDTGQITVNIYNPESRKEEEHQIPKVENSAKLPERKELAYQMGHAIQEYENRFNEIQNSEWYTEIENHFRGARDSLNKLLDKWLPQSDLVLKNAEKVRNIIFELNIKLNLYAETIDWFVTYRNDAQVYIAEGSKPPEPITNEIEKSRELLWGGSDESYKVQTNSLIRKLIDLLNKEVNDENTEKDNQKDNLS